MISLKPVLCSNAPNHPVPRVAELIVFMELYEKLLHLLAGVCGFFARLEAVAKTPRLEVTLIALPDVNVDMAIGPYHIIFCIFLRLPSLQSRGVGVRLSVHTFPRRVLNASRSQTFASPCPVHRNHPSLYRATFLPHSENRIIDEKD